MGLHHTAQGLHFLLGDALLQCQRKGFTAVMERLGGSVSFIRQVQMHQTAVVLVAHAVEQAALLQSVYAARHQRLGNVPRLCNDSCSVLLGRVAVQKQQHEHLIWRKAAAFGKLTKAAAVQLTRVERIGGKIVGRAGHAVSSFR